MNQMSKVWNFAANVHIDFSHSLVFKETSNIKWIQLSQYWPYRYNSFCILLWILFMWKPWEILMIFELFLDQILWRARNKWKFLTFYLKCAISRKILEVSKIWMTFFDSHSTKHLAKRKKWNQISRIRVENRNMKKKNSPPQNEIKPKPWNHDSNGRSQYL